MAFLISFGEDSELLQDYTGSARLLLSDLHARLAREFRRGYRHAWADLQTGSGPHLEPTQRGTVLYDAIYLAANEKLKSETGRKAIVVITDGVDQGSKVKLEDGR